MRGGESPAHLASHIHFKVRSAARGGEAYEFTSQLFFRDDLLISIYSGRAPYSERGDEGRLRNENDGIYLQGRS